MTAIFRASFLSCICHTMSERAPLLGNPARAVHHAEPSFMSSCKYAACSTYFNVFLIFVPLAITASFLKWSDTVVFTLNFLAIMPLAKLLGLGRSCSHAHVVADLSGLIMWRTKQLRSSHFVLAPPWELC